MRRIVQVPAVAAATALVLAVSSATAQARAGAPGAGAPGAAPASAGASSTTAAVREARATGKPVTVTSLTTATTTVTAEPEGGLELTEYPTPVRVFSGGAWVPVDTTLHRNADGTLSPAAVPGDTVTFSGGGTSRMATIAASGSGLALSWPDGALPAPAVSGSSATYRNVLPGVDLVLTATSDAAGGFSEVLVVHDATAARDPRLASLGLGVSGTGVQLAAQSDGTLTATASNGQGSYTAPAPRMWDSSVSAPGDKTAAGAAGREGTAPAAPGSAAASSVSGPASGARLAPVGDAVTDGGTELSLIPDPALLSDASARFPEFIDPTFTWHPIDGDDQHYAPVQSGCPAYRNYDTTDSSYDTLEVGYDSWPGGCDGTDYSYYQAAVPSAIWGAHLDSATVNTTEYYTSSCSDSAGVTLSWTGEIDKNTDWDDKPGVTGDVVTKSVGPNSSNCNGNYTDAGTGVGFDVLSLITQAASGHWSNFTFRLWENGNTNGDDFKRFGRKPYLQVLYNDTPQVPGGEKATANADGSGSVGCAASATNPPRMGHTASVSGPYVWATFNDKDGDEVQGDIRYWNASASTVTYQTLVAGDDLDTGGTAVAAQIPAAFTAPLGNGTVIGWQADATDGTYTSAWSAPCYFQLDPANPDPPTVNPDFSGDPAIGSTATFTITAAGGDAATEFVWGFDVPPATSAPPAAAVLPASGSPASATLAVTVPAPGPHNIWVYAVDSAGDDSAETNGQPSDTGTSTFVAAGDPAASYPGFSAALSAGQSFDDEMISTSATSSGAADGYSFPEAELKAAGWRPGGAVTVDGASFTLPDFGAGAPDNLLAANQTIGMGGAQGSALVFLATSMYGWSTVPDGGTGVPGSGPLAADVTVPAVPGGVDVVGSGCTAAMDTDIDQSDCAPASGTLDYAAGCAETQAPYILTVPDWITGPADIAAVTTPDRATATGLQADSSKIYAFAVPLDPGCRLSSVSLPDVSATVRALVADGASYGVPDLHILGMAVRNTSTATPTAAGAASAAPAGQAWTALFDSPTEDANGPLSGSTAWGNQTLRMAVSPSISARAGAQMRIRLSDPGFLSGDGDTPLSIGQATVALQSAAGSPVPTGPPTSLTFGGATAVALPEGGDIYSDPLTLPFAVTPGQSLLVSLYLGTTPETYLPRHAWASGAQEWVTAPGGTTSGATAANFTTSTSATPFTGTGSSNRGPTTDLLTGVDVTTPVTAAAPDGTPTVIVAGNNAIDSHDSGKVVADPGSPSIRVAGQLDGDGTAAGYSVVDGGVEAGQVMTDAMFSAGVPQEGGVSLLARVDRDLLSEPDVGTVVIDTGLEDLLRSGASATEDANLENAYSVLIDQLDAFGVNVILSTLTPCSGYAGSGDPCTTGTAAPTVDANRLQVDEAIDDGGLATAVPYCNADLDAAVTNAASPEALPAGDDAGDHVNLTAAGYSALAAAVTSGGCSFAANAYSLPPAP